MTLNLPYKVRAAIYVANVIGAPVAAYLLISGIIGVNEMALWSAEMTAVFALAGLNVKKPE